MKAMLILDYNDRGDSNIEMKVLQGKEKEVWCHIARSILNAPGEISEFEDMTAEKAKEHMSMYNSGDDGVIITVFDVTGMRKLPVMLVSPMGDTIDPNTLEVEKVPNKVWRTFESDDEE